METRILFDIVLAILVLIALSYVAHTVKASIKQLKNPDTIPDMEPEVRTKCICGSLKQVYRVKVYPDDFNETHIGYTGYYCKDCIDVLIIQSKHIELL